MYLLGRVQLVEEVLEISFDLVGKVLEQDIISEFGVLLLKKGAVLTESNIILLRNHDYKNVNVSEIVTFEKLYLKNIEQIKELFTDVNKIKEISIENWFEENAKFFQFILKNPSLTEEIYNINNVEDSLFRHSANVGIIAVILGKILGYSNKNLKLLWKMGVFHDIGKMKLSEELLHNQDNLEENEMSEYKKHAYYGWNILREVNDIDVNILNAVKQHHEKIDGTGYPKGLKVDEIPLLVQMISVANLVDKLSNSQGKTSIFQVMNYLINETQQNKLNPAIVVPFVRYKYYHYVGKEIILSDARLAKIIFIHDNEPSQPLVHVEESDEYIDLRKFHNLKIVDFS